MTKGIIFFILLCSSQFCYSQEHNFTSGFYVNQNGDTVKGYLSVDKKGSPTTFSFKKELQDANAENISFENCKGMLFNEESKTYWFGKRSMMYVDPFSMRIENIDSFKTELIALKLLYSGPKLSLFFFDDKVDHYFVGHDGQIEELEVTYRYTTEWEKSAYNVNPPTYFVNLLFRNQILGIIGEPTKKQMNFLENCKYEKWDLIKMCKLVN